MTQNQNNMLAAVSRSGLLSFSDILSLPNKGKTLKARQDINNATFLQLYQKHLIHATSEQVRAQIARYNAETETLRKRISKAVACQQWNTVLILANTLHFRAFDANFFICKPHNSKKLEALA